VQDVEDGLRARVVTNQFHHESPPTSIAIGVKPAVDRVVVAVFQVDKDCLVRRLVELFQDGTDLDHAVMVPRWCRVRLIEESARPTPAPCQMASVLGL
jgi:hypothetical protein